MSFKRVISLFCVLLLTFSLFVGCGKSEDDGDSSSSTVSGSISTADVSFANADGEAAYRIIRPSVGSETITAAAASIIKTVKAMYGVSTKNETDAEPGDGIAEIIIGETSRPGTAFARQYILENANGYHDEFVIFTVDDDIVIYGMTDAALTEAVDYFNKNYVTGNVVTGGINYINKSTAAYNELSICGISQLCDFRIVRPIYNVSYLTQTETDKLITYFKESTGYAVECVNDNIASTTGRNTDGSGTLTPTEPAEYEIIIGNATRDGVKVFSDDYNAYEIRIEDKKIYLNGGSAHATAMAVSEFVKLLNNNQTITKDMSVTVDYYTALEGYDTATTYRPTWGDEFDTGEIDYTKWAVNWDTPSTGYSDAADGRVQYRGSTKHNNNYVKDGFLYQCAVVDDVGYYGGWFDTNYIMNFLYGYLEISTLHPKGSSFWNALWTVSNPHQYPEFKDSALFLSETDVDECYGDGTWVYGNTFAWPTTLGKQQGNENAIHVNNRLYSQDDRGYYMDFHTYGFEWNNNTNVKFTCDGYAYVDQDLRDGPEQEAYSQPQLVRISLSVGSSQHGEPTTDPVEWSDYNKLIVDWVRIYQKDEQYIFNYEAGDGWVLSE